MSVNSSISKHKLGAGSFGRVLTMDALLKLHRKHKSPAVFLRWVDLKTGKVTESSLYGRLSTFVENTRQRLVFKENFDPFEGAEELDGNTRLLVEIVKKLTRNKVQATVVERTSPFHLSKDRSRFLVGIVFSGAQETHFPVYRLMDSDMTHFMHDFGDLITAEHVLDIVMSTLNMLNVMRKVGAHHRDIKDANMLYTVDCPGGEGVLQDPARLVRTGGCNVKFYLSDFGLVLMNPTPRSNVAGTPTFMSPLLFPDDYEAYEANHGYMSRTARMPDAETIYMTYFTDGGMIKLNPSQLWEKNDLYALATTLLQFNLKSAKLAELREFVLALLFGPIEPPRPHRSIMTIADAIAFYKRVRQNLAKVQRSIHVEVQPQIMPPRSVRHHATMPSASMWSSKRSTATPQKAVSSKTVSTKAVSSKTVSTKAVSTKAVSTKAVSTKAVSTKAVSSTQTAAASSRNRPKTSSSSVGVPSNKSKNTTDDNTQASKQAKKTNTSKNAAAGEEDILAKCRQQLFLREQQVGKLQVDNEMAILRYKRRIAQLEKGHNS